jgi:hypothetical protein
MKRTTTNGKPPGGTGGLPNIGTGFTNLAVVTAFNALRGKEENVDATV